ncbi:GldG family protein [Candidatus Sumerlaeota bacterium]|nr:GldG family protein [Candidatus Sumerlaeota bacterium]
MLKALLKMLPIAGIACLLGSFGWAIHEKYFDPISIALGGIGLLFFFTIFIKAEAANLKHYINVGFYSLFVLGLCAVTYLFAARYDSKIDLTAQKLHTLSRGTVNYLNLLKKDVEIVVFDTTEDPYRELLDQYPALTPRIQWSLHDPRKDPLFTRQFDANVSDQLIYIRHGDRKKRISKGEMNENTITNAIVEVTREREIVVYFLGGHGELAFQSPPKGEKDTPSVSIFKDFLSSRAMQVQELNLVERGFVPKDAALIIIAGPQRDLLPSESGQLEKYMEGGGKLLVFFDLPRETGVSVDFSNFAGLLRHYGIDDREEVIVDVNGQRHYGHPSKSR